MNAALAAITKGTPAGTVSAIRTTSARSPLAAERLLSPGEVAQMFRVDPKSVTRWAKAGRLSCVWTPGGQRRYLEAEVRGFLAAARPGPAPGRQEPATASGITDPDGFTGAVRQAWRDWQAESGVTAPGHRHYYVMGALETAFKDGFSAGWAERQGTP